jgi:hypothetical protein
MQSVCRFVVAMPTQHYKAVWHVQCADLAGFLGPPCGPHGAMPPAVCRVLGSVQADQVFV